MSNLFGDARGDTLRKLWMASLAKLVKPADAANTASGLVGMLPALEVYPDDAWCEATVRAVASSAVGVPNYRAISKVMDAWVEDHKPKPLAIAAPAPTWVRPFDTPLRTDDELAASWQDADGVRERVERIGRWLDAGDSPRLAIGCARLLALAVNKFASHNTGLLRPEWLAWAGVERTA